MSRKQNRLSLDSLDKEGACSRTEVERAKYVMEHGKKWVRQWWLDHPGIYEVAAPDVAE